MSDDSFTETTHEGFFSRMGNSFIGVLIGIALLVGSVILLFWNEGRAVERAADLTEGAKSVVTIDAAKVDPSKEGKLVHLMGEATTDEVLSDPEFGISLNALRLKRDVEMYQWDEEKETKTKNNTGGSSTKTTTYKYRKIWSSRLINSSSFKQSSSHTNPGAFPFSPKTWDAKAVAVGAFTLSPALTAMIDQFESLPISSDAAAKASPQVRDRMTSASEVFYLGKDASQPAIGDTRVTFEVVRPTEVSLVARQLGDSFEPYRTRAGNALQLLETGRHSSQEMFAGEHTKNNILTWVLRAAGALAMWIGLMLIAGPLTTLGNVIPFLGNLLGAGIGLFAALITVALSLTTIAVAWVFYRPLLAAALVAVALAAFYLLSRRGSRGQRRA